MNEQDVLKALECCVDGTSEACLKCVFGLTPPYPVCKTMVAKYALALIREKNAEIERLKLEYAGFEAATKQIFDQLKAEPQKN